MDHLRRPEPSDYDRARFTEAEKAKRRQHVLDNGYGLLPVWVSEHLTWSARVVFSIAVSRHRANIIGGGDDHDPDDGVFTLKYKDISDWTGLHHGSIRRALVELPAKGYLVVSHRHGHQSAICWKISDFNVRRFLPKSGT